MESNFKNKVIGMNLPLVNPLYSGTKDRNHFLLKCLPGVLFFLAFVVNGGPASAIIAMPSESSSTKEDEKKTVADRNIKTVRFHPLGAPKSYPVIPLGGQTPLSLRFDELYAPTRTYQYDIVHCNANWQPSSLVPAQYLEGFATNYIEQFSPSFNTYVSYNHYQLVVPNQNVRFRLPGNYLLKVYENNPDSPVIEKRFVVYQQKVDIDHQIKAATLARFYRSHHEIDFSVDYLNLPVQDAFSDVAVVLLQNHRWRIARRNMRPTSIRGSKLVYDYERENLFPGGNEFRPLDIRNLQSPGRGSARASLDSLFNVQTVRNEMLQQYFMRFDNNGQSLIVNRQGLDPGTRNDYAQVEFVLKDHSAIPDDADVYVHGMFNNWTLSSPYRLAFNSTDYTFRGKVLLKQGYHDYKFAVRTVNGRLLDTLLSGSFADTENIYEIIVYIRSRQYNTFLPYGYTKFSSAPL